MEPGPELNLDLAEVPPEAEGLPIKPAIAPSEILLHRWFREMHARILNPFLSLHFSCGLGLGIECIIHLESSIFSDMSMMIFATERATSALASEGNRVTAFSTSLAMLICCCTFTRGVAIRSYRLQSSSW